MRKAVIAVVILFVVLLAGAGAGAAFIWQRIHEPYKGFSGGEQLLEVESGAGAPAIGRRLIEAGVIRDQFTFRVALWWTGRSQDLQAGEYRFDRAMSAVDVVERLASGNVYARLLTFPEGLTIQEMSRVFESRGFGTAASFVAAVSRRSSARAGPSPIAWTNASQNFCSSAAHATSRPSAVG